MTQVLTGPTAVATDAGDSLLPELTAALAVEAARAERLIARLEHSVAQGDRMLAELGRAA